MAIVNRDVDVSQQKEVVCWKSAVAGPGTGLSLLQQLQVVTGSTYSVFMFPYAGSIQSGKITAFGVSGGMQVALQLQRHGGVGVGGTLIGCGISNMVVSEWSSVGVLGFSGLAPAGSTLLNFLAGDILSITTSVANTAVQSLMLEIVVKKTADIVAYNGIST